MDTIIALSSGAPPSGVAVIRISGPGAGPVVERLCGSVPEPRMASLRALRDPDGSLIDRGIVVWMPGPASFTGEDSAELQLHGSRAVIDRVLELATAQTGVRLAEAGEFARRAFANGKLDLTAAEGLGDLIAAETEAQRRFAVQQAEGTHGALYAAWRDRLLHARAMIEAEIDFADEDDVPGSVANRIWGDMAALREEIGRHLGAEKRGTMMRSGFQIVIVGQPNAGKSTLLNALSGSDRAIVSSEPGTTRDIVEVRLDLGGYLVVLADTAGLREADGVVEQEGIRRARARARDADLVLQLSEGDGFDDLDLPAAVPVWRIATKTDRGRSAADADLGISALTGDGVDVLLTRLTAMIGERAGSVVDVAPSRARHVGHLRACAEALTRACDGGAAVELRAEDLRIAAEALGKITGAIDVEEVLGEIFGAFCIGK
ncbi:MULTISPECIES: tRNA uridine-5-carboxymethylaminomethyl(34) synthesis GTPase MnmE [unclassified Roseitalea]|uniref:tRNA uridine-5-carboxymethylaminomethyl(34) synthesis GTPase MnmE n=1 Tax=unclassified Roseitalea TaxID=2639107 RepID=UPI00273DA482|nr:MULTISPECIES: tRNA uridine-5-carboxymethylaminomethyl(34) synthesis GTPase MnmE [unclassified Roseitalea]